MENSNPKELSSQSQGKYLRFHQSKLEKITGDNPQQTQMELLQLTMELYEHLSEEEKLQYEKQDQKREKQREMSVKKNVGDVEGTREQHKSKKQEESTTRYEQHHEITIPASKNKVWEAINLKENIMQWWSPDNDYEGGLGKEFTVGFYNRQWWNVFHLSEYIQNEKMSWECIQQSDSYPPTWLETQIIWEILETEGSTKLKMSHIGWQFNDGWFPNCNTGWSSVMYKIKQFCMGQNIEPWSQ